MSNKTYFRFDELFIKSYMKRILYVHHVSSVGGASFCLLNLIKALDRTSCEPFVLLRNDGPLADELRALDVSVFFMPELCAIPYNKSLYDYRTILGYWNVYKGCKMFHKFLEEHDFELVYLNNMMLYPYLREIKKKSIIHVREHWPLDEHKRQLRKAQKYVKRYATKVVAINHYSASIFSNCTDKTYIVYDWIDMTCRHKNMPFNEIFGEDVTDKKVYLFTGGTNWTKGPITVVRTFVNEMKGDDKRLLVLGVKTLPTCSFIKEIIKKVFHLVGRKDTNKELHKLLLSDKRIKCISGLYEIADIISQAYCNLSFFAIPHANLAMAESIILGIPSIAAKTSESLEYSKDGSLAILFELGNEKAYINAIKKMDLQHEDLKARIKNEGNEIAEMFSASRNIAVLNKVYSTIFDHI